MDITHYVQQFNAAVQQLAGGPDRSYLREAVGFKGNPTGETDWLDAIAPANRAGRTRKVSDLTNRQTYDALASGDQTAENFILHNFTPNDGVTKLRTPAQPNKIDVAHWFYPEAKDFLELSDPTSRTMKALMAGFWLKIDSMIILALLRTAVQRKSTANSTLHNVTIPASQVLPDTRYANADVKLFSAVKKRFSKAYCGNQRIYFGMGPEMWEALVNNSGDKLNNKDYVDSARYFSTGELPTVYGVTPLVHPIFEDAETLEALGLISPAEGELGTVAAWTENGVTWDEWKGINSGMEGPNLFMNGQSIATVDVYADCVRTDDLQVVQGAVIGDVD